MRRLIVGLQVVLLAVACEGRLSGAGVTAAGTGPNAIPVRNPTEPTVVNGKPVNVPAQALQRLTVRELDRSLAMLTGETHAHARELLPSPTLSPYDNDIVTMLPSASWLEGAERLVQKVAEETVADEKRRALVVGCTPKGNDDLACLKAFIQSFGRSVLRRPLSADEVNGFASLHPQALERGDFYTSVSLVMQRLLLDPEFHFRTEVGQPVNAAVSQLGAFELATRISFFLQGRSPSRWLLDAAASGQLATKEGVQKVAAQLIAEPEGKAHVQSFHAMWLGFAALPHDAALNKALATETSALINRVVYETAGDYRQLFLSTETYVDAALAKHYGLPAPSGTDFAWTPYGNSGRKGILSHGTLLSNGAKLADTSPTLRGQWIRRRLFCQEIPPPPPNVAVDLPPAMAGQAVCKKDRLAVHTKVGTCNGCHKQMDPIGFGLEQYDRAGRFRTAEEAHPECLIDGQGALEGVGTFRGPGALADLMVTTGAVESCAIKQLFRFQTGREETEADEGLLALFEKNFDAKGRQFDQLLVDFVSTDSFTQRRGESP